MKLEMYTTGDEPRSYPIIQSSVQTKGETLYFMVDAGPEDKLVTVENGTYAYLDLSHETAELLRKEFPFTAPSRVLRLPKTLGCGDRLGLATSGHLAAVADTDFAPVLAQQSIRELKLTGRSYEDVLDAATFAVFKAGYQKPWGADGDHLKTFEEIEYALSCGYTMLTLDCSEKIHGGADGMTDGELAAAVTLNQTMLNRYLDREFLLPGDIVLTFDQRSLMEAIYTYGDAILFTQQVYERFIKGTERDFELSIDETATPTTPAQHFFVANELALRGVVLDTLAPRFCGQFQKAVDYIGDTAQFEAELRVHAAIAECFDYKLSVHSGSDKFSIFPIVGRVCGGRFHLKTAGTSWLEAVKLVAQKDPALYRELHAFALAHFEEARQYYVVTTELGNVPALDTLPDAELPSLFDNADARQLIHITYGLILSARDVEDRPLFRSRLYALWRQYAPDYAALLQAHLGRHIKQLTMDNG